MNQSKSNSPTHNLYILPQKDAPEGTKWTAAGAGWKNKDGSVNVIANAAIPQGTKLQLRLSKFAQ